MAHKHRGERGGRRRGLSGTLQYVYFMRFGLLLWLFPLVFMVLDMGVTTSLSRGIWVPEYWQGIACVVFFLIASGCVALITVRIVAINGVERFEAGCPEWLHRLLVGDTTRSDWRALGVALAPAFLGIAYLGVLAACEEVPAGQYAGGLATGVLVAALFWYVVNALYYLSYERPRPLVNDPLRIGVNAAKTILLPRCCFGLKMPGEGVLAGGPPHTLEDIKTSLRSGRFSQRMSHAVNWVAEHWELPGYVYVWADRDPEPTPEQELEPEEPEVYRVYEAQLFAAIATAGFLGLFLVLYPLTAPGRTWVAWLAIGVMVLGWAWLAGTVASGRFPEETAENRRVLLGWKLGLTGVAALFCGAVVVMYCGSSPDRFPTLASLLLLLILLTWALGAVAFALDRFRVPVMAFALLCAVAPRMVHVYSWKWWSHGAFEEHYLSTVARADAGAVLPTPAEVVAAKLRATGDGQPLLVVTATGGGLHASAWTTQVLRQLYLKLAETDGGDGKPMGYARAAELVRTHMLLMSTVSGGSVGLRYYLEALHEGQRAEDMERMVVGAQCSSLEAVGWGLTYFDFPRATVPGLPWVWWPSSGRENLMAGPLGKDRTWALRRAFARNWEDRYCWETAGNLRVTKPPEGKGSAGPAKPPPPPLTLATLPTSGRYPAFTMNTTTAEGGERFLLANYRLPRYRVGMIEGAPAESFLGIFTGSDVPDLPLATAAQMSATFPYVSSSARIPRGYATDSAHFMDGGYYDNDGTSSAIEFLRYALDKPMDAGPGERPEAQELADGAAMKGAAARGGKLRILLVEIRNSADTDAAKDQALLPEALHPSGKREAARPGGVLSQIGFPPEGLWGAGHDSVTGRNRNGLDLLVRSHTESLELRQVIFDDQTEPAKFLGFVEMAKDPLSWSLTPRQRAEVSRNADMTKGKPDGTGGMKACYAAAAGYLLGRGWPDAKAAEEVGPTRCRLGDATTAQ